MQKSYVGLWGLLFKLGIKAVSIFAKLGKVGLASVTFASYSYIFSWQFAAMLIIQLFVHEMGHVWAMKRYGMNVQGVYFIPFMGAAAVTDDEFPTRKAEAVIAIMGPVWGFACAVATYLIYLATGNPIFAVGASFMALVNLFNLLPINPLDGGRIFKSLAFSVNSYAGLAVVALGLVAGFYLSVRYEIYLFAVIILVGLFELMFEFRNKKGKPPMTFLEVLFLAVGYIGISALFVGLMVHAENVTGADIAMEVLRG